MWFESDTEDSGPVRGSDKQQSDLNLETEMKVNTGCECMW